jgi:hypothetical protein
LCPLHPHGFSVLVVVVAVKRVTVVVVDVVDVVAVGDRLVYTARAMFVLGDRVMLGVRVSGIHGHSAQADALALAYATMLCA